MQSRRFNCTRSVGSKMRARTHAEVGRKYVVWLVGWLVCAGVRLRVCLRVCVRVFVSWFVRVCPVLG